MINTKCPYCGSNDVDLIIDIEVQGKLKKDGSFKLKNFCMSPSYCSLDTPIEDVVVSGDSEHVHGHCNKCYEYFDFEWDEGYYD